MPIITKKDLLVIIALSFSSIAMAQEAQEAQIIDESDEPAITIRKSDDDNSITEKRTEGVVEEVKVKSGGSTYYLKPDGARGVAPVSNNAPIRTPMWKIKEFDLGQKTKEQKQADVETEMNIESKNPLEAPALPPPTIE